MKLKNKLTGEIKDYGDVVFMRDANNWHRRYNSLAELCNEWSDYEKPKEYYYICHDGEIRSDADDLYTEDCKLIGNYFSTREEAEKAVNKLKAWKRLKDKGFRVVGWSIRDMTIVYSFDNYDEPDIPKINKDLDILFRGKK